MGCNTFSTYDTNSTYITFGTYDTKNTHITLDTKNMCNTLGTNDKKARLSRWTYMTNHITSHWANMAKGTHATHWPHMTQREHTSHWTQTIRAIHYCMVLHGIAWYQQHTGLFFISFV